MIGLSIAVTRFDQHILIEGAETEFSRAFRRDNGERIDLHCDGCYFGLKIAVSKRVLVTESDGREQLLARVVSS